MSTPSSTWNYTAAPVPVNSGRNVYARVSAQKIDGVGVYQRHPLGQTSLLVPPGSITAFAGSASPEGWLLCNGQSVDRQIYQNLFAIIGTTYGAGDGTSTFNVPNLRGRQIIGVDTAQSEFNVLGETGGEKTHTLTIDEMPSHSHNVNDPGHNHGVTDPGHAHSYVNNVGDQNVNTLTTQSTAADEVDYNQTTGSSTTGVTINTNTTGITLGSTGGGQAHNVLDPYLALHYIIKV
jgi:microcystin-dependent protein